ncbi:Hsp20 family protein, partial [Candidatus Kaiserbacteria bacterium]|nr:Hsp20 family protein [Candidatus Kaiserbacteria bacterium]
MKKPSFLERLTGGAQADDYDRILDEDHQFGEDDDLAVQDDPEEEEVWEDEVDTRGPAQDGELPVDMYQTDESIVIRALVAGVSPTELEISITRDMVTIRGVREEYQEAHDD